jgi:phosphohistidine phosphatase
LVLDLVRHGDAAAPPGGADADRPLSPAGRDAIARLAGRLKREGFRPRLILSSPLLRARQTASLLSEAGAAGFGIDPMLMPDGEPGDVVAGLEERQVREGHVLLVGHQPLLGRLVRHLAAREQSFATGTLVRLEFAAGIGAGAGRVSHVFGAGPSG